MADLAERRRPGDIQKLLPRQPGGNVASFEDMIETLIAQVQACEHAFDTVTANSSDNNDDVVFVDDFAACVDWCQPDARELLIPRSVDLAGRYNAMLKAALHVLLQIRELHRRPRG
jgi:nitrous oxide reductase accessory protein NosL